MFSKRYFYLVHLQYLGFRYSGWQQQPNVLTVERMVRRTIKYVLGHNNFKLLASGRTDAMVSAEVACVQLFLDDQPLDTEEFLPLFNENLPSDIRALSITEVDSNFNIIEAPKEKEYVYLFAFGMKAHPFSSSLMTTLAEPLDLKQMKLGAKLFEGAHDFINYTYKPTENTKTEATVTLSEIVENTFYTANFFPERSYAFRVKGKGFKRHQIRLMMGALFELGRANVDLDFIKETLQRGNDIKLTLIAPASGLILRDISF